MNLKNSIPKLDAKTVSKLTGVLFAAIASVVVYNEGYKEVAYPDSGGVWTICYGETNGVRPGQVRNKAACDAQLQASVNEHSKALVGLPEGMPDVVVIGAMDAAYNIGVDAFKRSEVYNQLLLRNYTDAGKAMLAWKYITVNGQKYDCSQFVNGKPNKVCYGLWKRRQWQSQAISNKYESTDVAIRMLPR